MRLVILLPNAALIAERLRPVEAMGSRRAASALVYHFARAHPQQKSRFARELAVLSGPTVGHSARFGRSGLLMLMRTSTGPILALRHRSCEAIRN